MDVVLLKDVEKLGAEGAVVHVKPGYARNFLVPSGLALPATPEQVKAVEERKRQQGRKSQRILGDAQSLKGRLESKSLTLKLTLGEDEKAFGSVTAHDILQALQKEGVSVEKHAIHLAEPIKALGIYDVPVRLHADVTANVKVWVVKA
ncbi:MAG: 50S ribosomal protein L9 [Candidatus Omnitrophica bacterium CG11_big_fil_rev_8_21_14_0_20_63_9]|nr:MAG: 50S ribosomal protein L9 [Candidatus Omnitrophica bacterium CG11_big_fil_rev_8_21_14_0_20_63_9]